MNRRSSSRQPARVLLIEPDAALRRSLGSHWRHEGFTVDHAVDSDDGFHKATRVPFDLVVLNAELASGNGFLLCRDVRRVGIVTPILMLSAIRDTAHAVKGLECGADDYVRMPVDRAELLARMKALLRRAEARPVGGEGVYTFGAIQVDFSGHEATRDGRVVNLSVREFQLLRYFIEHPGFTLSRRTLLGDVWGYPDKTATRTLDVHVANLRRKLEPDPTHPQFFLTVQRVGYRFKPHEAPLSDRHRHTPGSFTRKLHTTKLPTSRLAALTHVNARGGVQ